MKQSQQKQQSTLTESELSEQTRESQQRKPRADKLMSLKPANFECESEGFHVDPYDCSIFHLCVEKHEVSPLKQNQSDYITISFQCNSGFLYNPESNSCINLNESLKAVGCSNPLAYQPEDNFRFNGNNENEEDASTSSPRPPRVEYVTGNNDNADLNPESGNGLNKITTPFTITLSSNKQVNIVTKPPHSDMTPKRPIKGDIKLLASPPSSTSVDINVNNNPTSASSTNTVSPVYNSPTTYTLVKGRSPKLRDFGNPDEQSQMGNVDNTPFNPQANVPQYERSENNSGSDNDKPIIYILPQQPTKSVNRSKSGWPTTDDLPPDQQYSFPAVVVPQGRKPVVYVIRRQKPLQNESSNEQEAIQMFYDSQGKSTQLTSKQNNQNKNESKGSNRVSDPKLLNARSSSIRPLPENKHPGQLSMYDSDDASKTKAPIIYIISPPGSLQNSNSLGPRSSKSWPRKQVPNNWKSDEQLNKQLSSSTTPLTTSTDDIFKKSNNNQKSQVRPPGPSATQVEEPSIYLLPPWPELPEGTFDVNKTENNDNFGSVEPSPNWQSEINKPKTKSVPQSPGILVLPPDQQSPEQISQKLANNDNSELTQPNQIKQREKNMPEVEFMSQLPRFPSTTTPKSVRNTTYRTSAPTKEPPLLNTNPHFLDLDNLLSTGTLGSFDSTSGSLQQQSIYNTKSDSTHFIPPSQRTHSPTNTQHYPQSYLPPQGLPQYTYSLSNVQSYPQSHPPQQPGLPQETYLTSNLQFYPQSYIQPQTLMPRFGLPSDNRRPPSESLPQPFYSSNNLARQANLPTGTLLVWNTPVVATDNTYSNNGNVESEATEQPGSFTYPGIGTNNENIYSPTSYEIPNQTPSYTWTQYPLSTVMPSASNRNREQSEGTEIFSTQKSQQYQQESSKVSSTNCTQEGFYPVENDCKHFYRCVGAGSSFSKFTFSCGPGTVWDSDIDACNHPWATHRQDC